MQQLQSEGHGMQLSGPSAHSVSPMANNCCLVNGRWLNLANSMHNSRLEVMSMLHKIEQRLESIESLLTTNTTVSEAHRDHPSLDTKPLQTMAEGEMEVRSGPPVSPKQSAIPINHEAREPKYLWD